MNGMRILMISPTPTHPQDAGNRTRIFRLVEQLRSLGCNLSFVHYRMEQGNIEGMRRFWGEQLFVVPGKTIPGKASMELHSPFLKFRKCLRRLGAGWRSFCGMNLKTDEWCSRSLTRMVQRLHAKERYQMVWVEYVFLSSVLKSFDSSVAKILDTHDVFSDRHKRMVEQGMEPEWFSMTREREKAGLSWADWVVAIHEKDAEFFRSLGLSRVTTIGHFIPIHPAKEAPQEPSILFIGSDNSINLNAWEHFTREIFGDIMQRIPNVSVQVAGKICRRIPESSNYRKLGVVEDLAGLYASSTAAINPLIWGTGLKIKTIEPLAYGCPVVTTPAGIEGIEEAEQRGILVGRTPKEFAEWIERLLTRPLFRKQQSRSAQDFLSSYLFKNQQRLVSLLGDCSRLREEREHDKI